MKKEQFIKLGLTEETAEKAVTMFREELKGFIPKSRFDQVNDSKRELESKLALLKMQREEEMAFGLYSGKLEQIFEEFWKTDKSLLKELEENRKSFILLMSIGSRLFSNPYADLLTVKFDLSGLDLDGEGRVMGLDEEMKRLKDNYPELFRT